MDDDLVVRGSLVIASSELVWRFSRASGPGGQGVNTTDSRVQLAFDLANTTSLPAYLKDRATQRLASRLVDGCIVVTAAEQRSQLQNRRAAMERLADLLREAIAPPPRPRRATRPTKAATERRLKSKRTRSQTKRLRRKTTDD